MDYQLFFSLNLIHLLKLFTRPQSAQAYLPFTTENATLLKLQEGVVELIVLIIKSVS